MPLASTESEATTAFSACTISLDAEAVTGREKHGEPGIAVPGGTKIPTDHRLRWAGAVLASPRQKCQRGAMTNRSVPPPLVGDDIGFT